MTDDWLSMSGPQRKSFTLHLISLFGWVCYICGLPIKPGEESCQHLIPRSKGGRTTIENCRPGHRRCNSSVGDRPYLAPHEHVESGRDWFE